MTTPNPSQEHDPAALNLRAFLGALWRRRLVFVLVLIVVAGAVAAVTSTQQREYTAVAKVAATPSSTASTSPADYQDLLGTLASVAESRPVLEDVHAAIGSRSVQQLQDEVQASTVDGTVLINVAVTDPDPETAAQIANAVVARMPAHAPSTGTFVFQSTEQAAVPNTFSRPDLRMVVLAGLLLALGLAIAVSVAYDRTARTVVTAEDVVEVTDLPVLGVMPPPHDVAAGSEIVGDSAECRSLRALRISLEFASRAQPTRCLVVAGAGPDSWGGWLEVNLAVSLAEVGHRVLLVDADRRPGRRHVLLDRPGAPGLYDLLAGSVSLDGASVPTEIDGVSVVPLGNADLASPSLLEMRFRSLVEEIDEKYDVILVRAAPVTDSDDGRIMAIGAGMLLTVPAGRVKPRALESAVEGLRQVDIRVLGAVLLGRRR